MSSTRDISADEVRRLLAYDPFTGDLRWRAHRGNQVAKGSLAGSFTPSDGYLRIRVHRVAYLAHRVVWLHVYGSWPENEIDHIDGDRVNNRLHNLRDVPRGVNQQNLRRARSDSTHRVMGARYKPSLHQSKPWLARIKLDGVERHLGYYATPEEAHAAYLEAKRKLHEGNTL